jgi:hypothetical protein
MDNPTPNTNRFWRWVPLLVVLFSSSARADWTAAPGTVKVYVKKLTDLPAIHRTAVDIPMQLVKKWSATVVDDRPSYLVLQVPESSLH